MAQKPVQPSAASWLGLALPALLLSTGGLCLGVTIGRPSAVAAGPGGDALDTDGDGLNDDIEQILLTDPFMADTDGDGFSDLIEVAQQSDPLDYFAVPDVENYSVGMVAEVAPNASGSSHNLHVVMPVYVPGGIVEDMRLDVGFFYKGKKTLISAPVLLAQSNATVTDGINPGDIVLTVDMRVPEMLVLALGQMSFFAVATPPLGSPQSAVAAKLDLATSAGVVLAISKTPYGAFGGTGSGGSGSSGGADSVYRPLDDDDDIPPSWASGQFCTQETQTIGASGPVLTQEVSAAACEDADAHCMPGCANLVGSTFDVLDPAALIGG